nr:MAG TPA: hypothetical protein [Caudoviricetes sp.]
MVYYIMETKLNNITADTWRDVKNGDTLDQIARDTHDRAGTFEGLEGLSAYDLYRIADAAPAWDCLEPDAYDQIAEAAGLNPDDYGDVDDLMSAVDGRVALLAEDAGMLTSDTRYRVYEDNGGFVRLYIYDDAGVPVAVVAGWELSPKGQLLAALLELHADADAWQEWELADLDRGELIEWERQDEYSSEIASEWGGLNIKACGAGAAYALGLRPWPV